QDALAPNCEQCTKQASENGKQHAFGEQLPDDAEALGAEGQADADLLLAGSGAGEEHAGQIDDGEQQDQPDQGKEREQRLLEIAAEARGAGGTARKLQLLGEDVAAIGGAIRGRGLLFHRLKKYGVAVGIGLLK